MQLERTGIDLVLREPAGEPEGALVLNHGRGADEHDLQGLLDALDPERRLLGVTTGGPIRGIPPGGRHWYIVERVGYPHRETFEPSYSGLTEKLDQLLDERGTSWDRTVLGGFSQGTVMSYAVGLGRGRPRPAGILAFSGFIPSVEGWEADPTGLEGMPVFIHHGDADPVISAQFAERAADWLSAQGVSVEKMITNAAHWIPPESIDPARAVLKAALGTTPSEVGR